MQNEFPQRGIHNSSYPGIIKKFLNVLVRWIYFYTFAIFRSNRPEVFCKKGVLRKFAKFTRKHLCQSLFFNKVAGLRSTTLLKKRLQHRFFPLNFSKFLRTSFLTEHLRWLLLYVIFREAVCKVHILVTAFVLYAWIYIYKYICMLCYVQCNARDKFNPTFLQALILSLTFLTLQTVELLLPPNLAH